MNEARAIAALKQGNIDGLEYLVGQYQVQAIRAAYVITRDLPMAEDIVQTAFIRVYERIQQFKTGKPFKPWFMKIVINDALKAVKKNNRTLSLDEIMQNEYSSRIKEWINAIPDPQKIVEETEVGDAIWQALEQLSVEERTALVSFYYLELKVKEIAEHMQSPSGTVKWWLHLGRGRLRKKLHSVVEEEVSHES